LSTGNCDIVKEYPRDGRDTVQIIDMKGLIEWQIDLSLDIDTLKV
jgi:hypothetical protein